MADSEPLGSDLDVDESEVVRFSIDVSEVGRHRPHRFRRLPAPRRLRGDATDVEIASLTTAAIHITQKPLAPVRFSWWTEIATPIAFGPDGTLIDEGFEASLGGVGRRCAGGGTRRPPAGRRRRRVVRRRRVPGGARPTPAIADGYEREDGEAVPEGAPVPTIAAETLERLRTVAADPRVRLHAMPFAAPRLPALLSSGLGDHIGPQWVLGDETFERLLGEEPDAAVARPPGLEFDQATVDALDRGVTTILGADDSVTRPPQEFDFAPPPAATIATSTGVAMQLLPPDPGAQTLLDDPEFLDDPTLTSQIVLGELATIWKEQPVPRGRDPRTRAGPPPRAPAGIWGARRDASPTRRS